MSSGIIAHKDMLKDNPDLLRRFMAATSKAVQDAVNDPKGAVDTMLKANPKPASRTLCSRASRKLPSST